MHRALNDALHELHLVAKGPSLTTMVKGLKNVPGASRTTIYNAFSSQRLPMSGVVDALVVYLAERVRNVSPAQVDAVSNHFDNLWYLAEAEARSCTPTSTPAPPRPDSERPAEPVVLSLPVLDAPRQRLALEPVRLRSRLDSLREAFGDAEVDEAVIAGVAEAISALPGPYGDRTGVTSARRSPGATGLHGDRNAM
ncbi:hypothetical protein IPZ58_16840 [Streptomyces roseoverticillatus]|uniref:hypothetical protein n=1 Tax=Streptomyces roseoverticillatus TaxID=66429 RepID=UPI001F15AE99|nr:hypothetical protein [Streptomyces roseoverticillatus]MCF3103233.1 hypothetical protein [Streptomyces roseoverticillatus]